MQEAHPPQVVKSETMRASGPALLESNSGMLLADGFDTVAQDVGALAALVLVELVSCARLRGGELLVRASERSLAADLSRWGSGFSRASIRKHLAALECGGYSRLAGHGVYELAAFLLACPSNQLGVSRAPMPSSPPPVETYLSGPSLVPAAHQEEPIWAPTSAALVLVSDHSLSEVDREDSSTSLTQASAEHPAVARARALGVGRKALAAAQEDPERATAWLDYAANCPTVNRPAGLVYRMMTDPRRLWPPAVQPPVSPLGARPSDSAPSRATAQEISEILATATDASGVPLAQSGQYREAFARSLSALGHVDVSSARAQYTAHFEALVQLGYLANRRPPFGEAPLSVSTAGAC